MRAVAFLPLVGLSLATLRSPEMALMPRETSLTSDEEMPLAMLKGVSPIPTQAPRPRYAAADLFQRDVGSNTCGYVHYYDDPSESVYPITCPSTYLCTNVGNVRDCCKSSTCSTATFSTACLDADACPTGGPGSGTFCCTFSTKYPYCVSYLWSTSTDPSQVYTLLNCRVDTRKRIGVIEADSTTSSSSETSSSSTTDATDSTTDATPTSTTPATDTNADTTQNSGGGGKSKTGAIVGGVVGGLAAVGLAVLAAVFFFRKRRGKEESAASSDNTPPAAPEQPHYSPQQQMQHPVGGGYVAPGQTQSMYGPPPVSPNPSGGYPSPVGSPAPYQGYGNMAAESSAPTSALTPGRYSNSNMGTPGPTFATPSPDNTAQGQAGGYAIPPAGTYSTPLPGGYHTPQAPGVVAEAPAQNPVGSVENRAELG